MEQLINKYVTVGSGITVPSGPLQPVQTLIPSKNLLNSNKNLLIANIGTGINILQGLVLQDHTGKYGSYGLAGDQIYNGATNFVSKINPAFGLGMKGYGLVHDTLAGLGASTDGETKIDALLNSKLAGPIGLVNGIFGSTSNKMYLNQDTINSVGSSFGGTVDDLLSAKEKSNKKFGLLSLGKKNSYDDFIREALRKQLRMTNIADEAKDLRAMINDQLGINYKLKIDGGIDFTNIRNNKLGGKLSWEPTMRYDITEFKEGGNITWEPVLNYDFIQEFLEGGKTKTLEELIEYAKLQNPRFILRLSEVPRGIKFIDDEGNEAEGSHYMEWGMDDEGNAIVYPRIQEMDDKSLKFLNTDDAWNRALKTKNFLKMSLEEAEIFFAEDPEYNTAYKRGWPEFFKKFKQGGSIKESETPKIEETTLKNLIPEGALHKNKHHMENDENITKKGIPVIDDDGNLQAEIERDELIVTLEVTKFIEERYKKYYSDELTAKEKDKLAIEVGELLVYEILNNTDDRTDLISKCEKGGKL